MSADTIHATDQTATQGTAQGRVNDASTRAGAVQPTSRA
jgi:hypothetical protein